MNYRMPEKPPSASCFQPCAKGDEALPDQWKFRFTCRSIRSGTLPTIWTFETQTSNPPFFSRPAVRALSVILSELCLSSRWQPLDLHYIMHCVRKKLQLVGVFAKHLFHNIRCPEDCLPPVSMQDNCFFMTL